MSTRMLCQVIRVLLVSSVAYLSQVLAFDNTDLGAGFINAAAAPYSAPTIPDPAQCNALTPSNKDATTNIQDALDDLSLLANGGTVYLPKGIYCVKGTLTIPSHTTLRGIFDSPPTPTPTSAPVQPPPIQGTVLLAISGAGSSTGTPFIAMQQTSTIEGFSIIYPAQVLPTGSSWTPVIYPYAIRGSADTTIQNILLWNPYQGIDLATGYNFRHRVKGVVGQPISVGIKVDNSQDVGKISDVHFWPYWSLNNAVATSWIQKNGTAFFFARTDGEMVSDVFAYGYSTCMLFQDIGNGSASGMFTNVHLDYCGVGLNIWDSYIAGLYFTNFFIHNTTTDPLAPRIGIWKQSGGSSGFVSIVNGSILGGTKTAILWEGAGHVSASNVRFGAFTAGNPSVVISNGSAMIQDNSFYGSPGGTPAIAVTTTGRVVFTGNSLFGATVVGSGPFFLQANNGP